MNKLTGKIALVTGASKGIGAGIAKAFAAEGAAVIVNYATSKAGAEKIVAEITANGGKAIAVKGDVSKQEDIRQMMKAVNNTFGKLDILVNNAGIYKFEPLEGVTEQLFHDQFNTNVLGPILLTQEALPYLNAAGGSVINISSVVSTAAIPASVIYSATKSALDSVTRVLANELGTRKIRVNTLAPGGVETEGTHTAGIMGSDFEKQMIDRTPLGRLGQPDDIAKVAVFLASDDSGWITGERITVSGGLY